LSALPDCEKGPHASVSYLVTTYVTIVELRISSTVFVKR
jgi:hypothetical protein